MDWTVIGSLAGIAAVVVAVLQFQHSRSSLRQAGVSKVAPPPKLTWQIIEGRGSYSLPEGWKSEVLDPRWRAQSKIERDLEQIVFGFLILENRNDNPIHNLNLHLSVSKIWSATVERTKYLAKPAVGISIYDDGVAINVADMPAKEKVYLSVICGGVLGAVLQSGNASVELDPIWS